MSKGRIHNKRHVTSTANFAALDRGVAISGTSVRVRLARVEDKSAIATFLRQAMDMTPLEDPGFIPTVCPSIVAGLARGRPAFFETLADELNRASNGPVAFALVAEDADSAAIGAIACAPPYNIIRNYVDAFPAQAQQTALRGFVGFSKIIGMAVQEDFRRCGVGH